MLLWLDEPNADVLRNWDDVMTVAMLPRNVLNGLGTNETAHTAVWLVLTDLKQGAVSLAVLGV